MAPPPPPGLMDDLIGEILLRLPPADPACLFRAALVCKRWRSLVLGDGGVFLREYRAFHRTAPVLGFFHDEQHEFEYGDDIFVPRFVPTTTMPPPRPLPEPAASAGPDGIVGGGGASAKKYSCRTLDCRHGRVLFHTVTLLEASTTLTVWDPVTGEHTSFSPPSDIDPFYYFTGAVLSAAADDGDCNHLDLECSSSSSGGGGAFLVVIAGISRGEDYDEEGVAWARVYSSETAVWSAPATLDFEASVHPELPSLLAAGAVYFMLDSGTSILKYDLQAAALSVMKPPPQLQLEQQLGEGETNMVFAAAQDGELGAATVEGYSLHLWSWHDGVGEWARVRVIELDAIIPFSIGDPFTEFSLAGSAQGAGLIFISVNDARRSIFTVDLKSGRITKTGQTRNDGNIFPLMSFCTPGPY